ncbi:type VII secretion target [Mycobacterium shimoidei]|jgi:hypothetical protein|uniref:ESX-1 secretion-associated protein n=1 Tax=Mycobacterium shimoidei TaxID=29313 RepID=A0A1E3TJT9_MYCSH|nr:type VII secretion target [Mycobacterium shimoidei]MCV7257793.1 ESX-1 secretion-associated protein [Mycobacterium shimoidei]ODR14243.1 hypothetical protein BHQ16_07430 [Mycobacterium shimoidei]ORW83859.1 hypothetical protein AWC26_00040 [Mycobacterium shimoidei]SRX91950.1 hypothetical protein MSP7336_00171 [Mycobacterium shimoidei]
MGQADSAWIDVTAVRTVANRFDDTAEIVSAANRQLARLAFDGATAGRAHVAAGDALRTALSRLTDELTQWARACAEIAVALRSGADRYADADRRGAARIG